MKKIELPRPFSECIDGPIIEMKNAEIVLKYDYDEDDKVVWTNIRFINVYAFNYKECEYQDSTDFIFGLCEIENSNLINSLLNAWESKGRDPNNAFGGEPSKVKHFRLYIDDSGIYDVVCKEFIIEEDL